MRTNEIMPLATEDSRCGEIFVSNKADKWTFFCSYCQKGTRDIGVFICHIRLDHLSSLLDSETQKEIQQPEVERCSLRTESQPMLTESLLAKAAEHQTDIDLIKEETLSQHSFEPEPPVPTRISQNLDGSLLIGSNEIESVLSTKNTNSTSYPVMDLNEEYFTITSKDPDITEEDSYSVTENHEIIRVLYSKDGKVLNNTDDGIIANDDIEDSNNLETISIYSIDDDDDEDLLVEHDKYIDNNDDNRASSSKRRKENRNLIDHVCDFCNKSFHLRSELDLHLKKMHNQKFNELPLKCKECKKAFKSLAGYKNHLNSHDARNQKQCPVCKATHNLNYFITHVMGHESNTCFPCMVCGKIFTKNAERMKHWESHAKDKPYACDLCFRRFRQKHFLLHHLKSHGQYKCYFCPEKFITSITPRPPYVCPNCEVLPDIGEKIEHHKLFAHKNYGGHESEEE